MNNEIKHINKPNFKKYFPPSKNSSFIVLESHGDGSCFIHSLCRALTQDYELLTNDQQLEYGREYRSKFKNIINEQEYYMILEKLKNGKNAALYKENEYDYLTFKKKLEIFAHGLI